MGDEWRELERRLVELESKISFQESETLDMNKAIMERTTASTSWRRRSARYAKRSKKLAGEGQPPLPANERPPHY